MSHHLFRAREPERNPHPWDGRAEEARPRLPLSQAQRRMEDGDVLLWHGKYAISRFFESVSMGWMSHAALIAYWDATPMLLQAEFPHIQAVPLWKTVKEYPGDVYWYKLKPEYRAGIDVTKVLREGRMCLGLDFSVGDVFRDLMHRRFGTKLPKDPSKPRAMFCSEFVSHCFRAGGMPIVEGRENLDTLPQDVANSPNLVFEARLHRD